MKFKLVKLIFAVSALGCTTLSYAQNLTNTDIPPSINNSGPLNSLHGWHLNIAAFYNRFSNNGTAFAENLIINSLNTETEVFSNVNTRNHFGYDAGIGYFYDCLDSSIDFHYFQINGNDSSDVSGRNVHLVNAAVVGISTEAEGEARFSYSSASLTAGHLVRLPPAFDVYYYGGLVYTHFSKNMTSFSSGESEFYQVNAGVSFNGFGPTFGVNGSYYPFYSFDFPNFSISGGIQATFLYGNRNSYEREIFDNTDRFITTFPADRTVIPVSSADLALNYLLPLNGFGLKTTLGYQLTELYGVSKDSENYAGSEINASFQGFFLNFTGIF